MDAGREQGGKDGPQALRRLLQARDQARVDHGAAPSLPRQQPATLKRAALTAVARAFDRLYQLPSHPLGLTPAAITLAEMAELLPQPALFSIVEGGGDALGVVALCPALMTALIEMQTLGRITARPVDNRKPTRSDAIICADFVNMLLDELGKEMPAIDGFEGFSGFRYASFLDDPRPLLLMLEDCPYRVLGYRLRLGGEPGREGTIFVALPQPQAAAALPAPQPRGRDNQPPTGPAQNGSAVDETGKTQPAQLSARVAEAPVDVVGVLCRRAMRLGDLRALRPGQLLPLPRLDLSQTRLETRFGQVLAIGKLGEAGGFHAIRLRVGDGADQHALRADGQDAASVTAAQGPKDDPIPAPPDPARRAMATEPPIADLAKPDRFRPDPDEDQGPSDAAAQQKAAITG